MGDGVRPPAGDPDVLAACKTAVQQIVPNATVVLFGSRSRGIAALDADYDLLVLVDDVTTRIEDRISDALYDVELAHDVIISPLVVDRYSWDGPEARAMPLHANIDRDGIAL